MTPEPMKPGNRFNMLTFIRQTEHYVSPGGQRHAQGEFRCDCGRTRVVRFQQVRNGAAKNCGCVKGKRGDMNPCPVGQKFGKLTVLEEAEPKFPKAGKTRPVKRLRQALCICECGNQAVKAISSLLMGGSTSCGCGRRVHGQCGSRTYRIWASMVQRASGGGDERARRNYFDRGIRVCKRWRKFSNFFEDMGEAPEGRTLDRIDNNKGYSHENCRWATMKEQARNKRTNVVLEYRGTRLPIVAMAEKFGLTKSMLGTRIARGWTMQQAIETPSGKHRNFLVKNPA